MNFRTPLPQAVRPKTATGLRASCTLLAAGWLCYASAAGAAAATLAAAPAAAPSVQDLPLADGGFQRLAYFAAVAPMRGIIVMFPGGAGEIGIDTDGSLAHGDNFVVRTRDLWRARGYGIVLVDALEHRSLRGARSSAAYAAVTRNIVAFVRARGQVPVWVLGTSQGSIAAMNAASHAQPGELAGVILTESVSLLGASHETVFDAAPEQVQIPALVVANRDDRCKVAPPTMAEPIAQAMRATHATVLFEQGGLQHTGNDCSSLSPHGYDGIEPSVVDHIIAWMQQAHS